MPRVPDRPQPDRPRRRDRDGADDGGGRARRRGAGPLEPSPRGHARGRARAVQRAAVAAPVRGRPGLHPRDGSLGRRLGARATARSPQAIAPGHDRPRCVYVDFLNTGPAVSKTLRTRACNKTAGIRTVGRSLRGRSRSRPTARSPARSRWHLGTGAPVVHLGQGDDRRDRRAHPALPPQQRLEQHGRRRLCAGAARGRAARRHGVRAVLPDRASRAAADRHGPDHVGPVPLQARRAAAQPRLQEFTDRYGVAEDGKYVITRDVGTYAHHQGGRGRPRLAAWRRVSELPARARRRSCARRSGR